MSYGWLPLRPAGSPRCRVDRVSISDPDAEGDATVVSELSLQLRAKRAGGSQVGRIYTIDIVCTDASGNAAQAQVTVTVPHDSGGQ